MNGDTTYVWDICFQLSQDTAAGTWHIDSGMEVIVVHRSVAVLHPGLTRLLSSCTKKWITTRSWAACCCHAWLSDVIAPASNPNWGIFQCHSILSTCCSAGLIIDARLTLSLESELWVETYSLLGRVSTYTPCQELPNPLLIQGIRLGGLNTKAVLYWWSPLHRGIKFFFFRAWSAVAGKYFLEHSRYLTHCLNCLLKLFTCSNGEIGFNCRDKHMWSIGQIVLVPLASMVPKASIISGFPGSRRGLHLILSIWVRLSHEPLRGIEHVSCPWISGLPCWWDLIICSTSVKFV